MKKNSILFICLALFHVPALADDIFAFCIWESPIVRSLVDNGDGVDDGMVPEKLNGSQRVVFLFLGKSLDLADFMRDGVLNGKCSPNYISPSNLISSDGIQDPYASLLSKYRDNPQALTINALDLLIGMNQGEARAYLTAAKAYVQLFIK